MGKLNHPLYAPLPDSFEERVLAPPPPADPPKPRYSWLTAMAMGISLSVVGAIIVMIIPKFALVYEEVKVALPPMTRALVAFSVFVSTYPWVWLLGTIAVSWWMGGLKKHRRLALFFATLLLGISIAFFLFSLFSPLIGTLDGLN